MSIGSLVSEMTSKQIQFPDPRVMSKDRLIQKIAGEGPGKGSVSWEDAFESLVFDVPFEYEYDARCVILGYAWTDPVSKKLHRRNPIRHPIYPHLVAWNIDTVERLSPREAAATNPNRIPGTPKVNVFDANLPGLNATVPQYTANYAISRISVTFKPPPFDIFEDDQTINGQTVKEYQRYVEFGGAPQSEWLTQEGAQWKYVTAPVAGQTLPSQSQALLESKVNLNWIWHRVPEDFVCADRGSVPYQWWRYMNFVNNAAWPTQYNQPYARFTLLNQPFSYKRMPMPLRYTDGTIPYYVTIQANFLAFYNFYPGDEYQGHNTAPCRSDYKYHLFSSDGTINGLFRYPEFDFDKLFKYWNS